MSSDEPYELNLPSAEETIADNLALRKSLSKDPVRPLRTKKQCVEEHNRLVGIDPGKMSKYDSFDEMPEHIKQAFYDQYVVAKNEAEWSKMLDMYMSSGSR